MEENTIMMLIWLSIFIIALVAEISTEAIVSVWFCIGSLIALAVTYIPGMPWWGELIVFLATSALALLAFRPLVLSKLERITHSTNIDTIIGKKGTTTKEITELEFGEVRIEGVLWTALLAPGCEKIEKGSIVEVVSVEGNKLYVRQTKAQEEN